MEGWIRRQRFQSDGVLPTKQRRSQWISNWMLLKDKLLYLYANNEAKRADIVINVAFCYLSNSTNLKTSKKLVFSLCWNLEMINFALYSAEDLKSWMHALRPICQKSLSSFASGSISENEGDNICVGGKVGGSARNSTDRDSNALFVRSVDSPTASSYLDYGESSPVEGGQSQRSANPLKLFRRMSRQRSFASSQKSPTSMERSASPCVPNK